MRIIRTLLLIILEFIFGAAGYKIINAHPEYVNLINWPNMIILSLIIFLFMNVITGNMVILANKITTLHDNSFKAFILVQTIVYYSRIMSNLLFIDMLFLITLIGKKYLLYYNIIWILFFIEFGNIIGHIIFIHANNIDYETMPDISHIINNFKEQIKNIKDDGEENLNETENIN